MRTIKLRLGVVGKNTKEEWNRIRQITDDAWKAANWIAAGQYLNDQLMRRLYARKKIDPKNMEEVTAAESDFKNVFGTKRAASTERDIKEAFPNLPPCVTNSLNQLVALSYNSEKRDMLSGMRSLRTYKKGMPVVTRKDSISFKRRSKNKEHRIVWTLGRNEKIKFKIFYGRDKANNRLTVERILEGVNDYSKPMFQYKDRDLFLLLPVKEPDRGVDLDADVAVGVDLGLAIPAYVAMSKGKQRRAIGSIEDFLRVRTQMQNRHRRITQALRSVLGGHGRKRKMRALNRIKGKESAFSKNYNHYVSKMVIDFAIRNRAGIIKLEMLEGFGAEHKKQFVLRNWSYFDLQSKIKYKSEIYGIKVVFVDPYHTSQTCSECGHFEEGQRKSQSEFVCKSCGAKMNADYNAAVNIARSKKIVTKKEQCEYHKKTKTASAS